MIPVLPQAAPPEAARWGQPLQGGARRGQARAWGGPNAQAALAAMRLAYRNTCAYLGIQVDTAAAGGLSIDHFRPKGLPQHAHLVWTWDNWRLACTSVNARKGDHEDVMDPFLVPPGCFRYDFVLLRTSVADDLPSPWSQVAQSTLDRLRPDDLTRGFHEEALACLQRGEWSPAYFERRCPFLASELRRQGLWRWP